MEFIFYDKMRPKFVLIKIIILHIKVSQLTYQRIKRHDIRVLNYATAVTRQVNSKRKSYILSIAT